MLKKEFSFIELINGKKYLSIVFQDKQYALLSTFFCTEVESFEKWIRENIMDVLQGKAERREIAGNVCELLIEKENTTVYDMLAEDGMGNRCFVSTKELLSLIDEWHEEKLKLSNHA